MSSDGDDASHRVSTSVGGKCCFFTTLPIYTLYLQVMEDAFVSGNVLKQVLFISYFAWVACC